MADINFGILDTQMPGRIAAIPQQQQAQQAQNAMQLMQVQQTMQQNALAKAKMEEYTRGVAEKNALRGRMTQPGFNIYDPAHQAEIMGLSPDLAPGLIKHALDVETAKSTTAKNAAQTKEAGIKTARAQQEWNNQALRDLIPNPSDDNLRAWGQDAVIKGIYSLDESSRLVDNFLKIPLEERANQFKQYGAPAAAPVTPTELSKYVSERAAMLPGDPRIANWDAKIAELSTAPAAQRDITNRQGADRIKQGWGQLNVAQRNASVNEARLELQKNAPKLGLVDPEDIDRVAQGVASGRIPVDRLNGTTAKIFAGLLKANPDLDFTKTSIQQAEDKASAVTTARIGAEQTRATSLTPEMIKQAGEAYNTNGKLPSLGSGAQAAVDRVAILRYASENNPTDATTKAVNKAQLDALVPLAKQEAAVTNYVKTFDKNIELARAALTKVSNTNIPALNAWLINPAQRQLTGDPDLKALGVYVSSLQAEFAKIQSGAMGNSVTADAAIKRAQDTINTADSPRAFRAALDAMVKESRNRLDSFEDTRKEMTAKVRGQPAPATSPPPAGAGATVRNW